MMNMIFQIPNVKITVEVNSLEEASREFQKLRDEYNIGASDMRGRCGEVYSGCREVGRIHYNGKIEEKK